MYRESLGMLLDEIKRCNYTEKLKSLSGDTLTEYMKFIMNIIPFFKQVIIENL